MRLQCSLPADSCCCQLFLSWPSLVGHNQLPGSSRRELQAAGATREYLDSSQIVSKSVVLMLQVEKLHSDLRDCCDLMGIGLGGGQRDTIAEVDGPAAGSATGAKDQGDVSASSRTKIASAMLPALFAGYTRQAGRQAHVLVLLHTASAAAMHDSNIAIRKCPLTRIGACCREISQPPSGRVRREAEPTLQLLCRDSWRGDPRRQGRGQIFRRHERAGRHAHAQAGTAC